MASSNLGPLRHSIDKPGALRNSNDLQRDTTKSSSTKDTGKKLLTKKETSKDKLVIIDLDNVKLLKNEHKARSDSKSLTKSKKSLTASKQKSTKNLQPSPKKPQKSDGFANSKQSNTKGMVE